MYYLKFISSINPNLKKMVTSEQFNKLIESNEARNVRPKLLLESICNIEGTSLDKDYTQIVGQAFGSLSKNNFSTTSKVTLSAQSTVCSVQRIYELKEMHGQVSEQFSQLIKDIRIFLNLSIFSLKLNSIS